jgi:hypothetical protein
MQLRSRNTTHNRTTGQSNKPTVMKLRSGTTLRSDVTILQQLDPDELYTILCGCLHEKIDDQHNHPVTHDINNLIYTLRLYETFNKHLRRLYNVGTNRSVHSFIIVSFKKTIELMSNIIAITYKQSSIEYTDYTKGLIVKTLYKLNQVLSKLRFMLELMECECDYITKLLQISIEKKGEKILDKDSIEARTYYCYRYLYKSKGYDNYNISSYADGKYCKVENYNYHLKGNASKDVNDDLLIKDYKKMFELNETTDRYDIVAYDNE